jgi:hypothetical protein
MVSDLSTKPDCRTGRSPIVVRIILLDETFTFAKLELFLVVSLAPNCDEQREPKPTPIAAMPAVFNHIRLLSDTLIVFPLF